MKMHTFKFLLFPFFLSLTACNAQKNRVECAQAQRGNTGHRGIVPKGEEYTPTQGKDYFAVQIKTPKACTIELVSLTVKDYGGQVVLKPIFAEHNTTKMKTQAGQIYYIRVEKDADITVAKPAIATEGVLTYKIGNKLMKLPIEKFEMILPQ
jgi:hypothetical protein